MRALSLLASAEIPGAAAADAATAGAVRYNAYAADDDDMNVLVGTLADGDGKPNLEKDGMAEVYSVPRVTRWCRDHGLPESWSLDARTEDEDGRPWDFDCEATRARAELTEEDQAHVADRLAYMHILLGAHGHKLGEDGP